MGSSSSEFGQITDVSKSKFTTDNASETDEHCRIRIGRQARAYESRSIGPVWELMPIGWPLKERTDESNRQEGKEN